MTQRPGQDLEVSVDELSNLRATDPTLILLDCREPEELKLANVAGALHIPMREIPGRLDELDPEHEIVVMCHHGVRSMQVTRWLRENAGLDRVRSLRGGIDAWSTAIDPSVPRY